MADSRRGTPRSKPKKAEKPKKLQAPRPQKAARAFRAPTAQRQASQLRQASGREVRERHQRGQTLRQAGIVAAVMLALAVVLLAAFLVLRNTSAFSITVVEAEPTDHVTQQDVENILEVPEGSTLLNLDTDSIEASLKKNPWVESVSFERVFPNTLRLVIHERVPDRLVVMSAGSIAWYLSSDGTWIQPTKIVPGEDQSVNDAALQRAVAEGVLLITDVPASVSPEAGAVATDEEIAAVQSFREGFSASFAAQVVSYSASGPDAVTCTLASGVEVLLGSPNNVSYKEQIVSRLLEQYPGQVTYINVRVPSDPAVRRVGSDEVAPGTGAVDPEALPTDVTTWEQPAEPGAEAADAASGPANEDTPAVIYDEPADATNADGGE